MNAGPADSDPPADWAREVNGPPWILADRGLPLVAPENTLASFQRALQVGADGLYYDLRASADLEPVLLRDESLWRTTGMAARPEDLALPELSNLDAGGWFSKQFAGEPIPFLDEVLNLVDGPGAAPMHFIELHGTALVPELCRRLEGFAGPLGMRVASARREVCLELHDAGIPAVWLVPRAGSEELAFVRDARLAGVAVTTALGWQTNVSQAEWPCERWIVGIESASELYAALAAGVNGVITPEVRRARAVRALVELRRSDSEPFPIQVPALPVASASLDDAGGEWRGQWRPAITIRNPFASPVRARVELYVRRGAFEVEGLPLQIELKPGEQRSLDFGLRGGSWSPGGDPSLAVLFEWSLGPGREAGRLLLDQTLLRLREVNADGLAQRVEMLRESPGMTRATMTVQRRGQFLALAVENPGGLEELRATARLDGQTWVGSKRLRIPLPPEFDQRAGGVPFSCGFWGVQPGQRASVLRRWCGGLPPEPRSGESGRLVPRPRA